MHTHDEPDISSGMLLLLATACGLIVANLYYAQTLVGPISRATGLSPGAAGLIVTLTQIGYTLGLTFIVPLGDLMENRRLVFSGLLFTAAALVVAAFATNAAVFLAAALAIGLGSVVADHSNWHVVFGGAAAMIVLLAFVLRAKLPQRVPAAPMPYAKLIGSLWHLVLATPVLRRRAAYQAGLFGSFSLFWTATPLMLAGPAFHMSQTGIAIFALVGMAGAVASPIAGRLADSGHTLTATAAALLLGIIAFALPLFDPASRPLALGLLVAASIILDMGVAASLVLGQRAIFGLGADVRSRLNGLYLAMFFLGGAVGSALGGWVYATYGWHALLLTGMAFPGLALLYWITEYAQQGAAQGKIA